MKETAAVIEDMSVAAAHFPLPAPETDGTHCWDGTTIVVVRVRSEGKVGLGYTYNHAAVAPLIRDALYQEVVGADPFLMRRLWNRCSQKLRNFGRSGLSAAALAAVDTAVWDLAAQLLELPLYRMLGGCRTSVPVYGSGGFTSLDDEELVDQLSGWAQQGMHAVKMKVGRNAAADRRRVELVAQRLPEDVQIFVDANGALDRQTALSQAQHFAAHRVTWFEEPVDAEDFAGLRMLRDQSPAGLAISAGEYGYQIAWFRRLLEAGGVDVLQADITRCAGLTGFLTVAECCVAHHLPLSSHTAPALHRHAAMACPSLLHCEWFADHVAVEKRLFHGHPIIQDGCMSIDEHLPGHGLELDEDVFESHRVAI